MSVFSKKKYLFFTLPVLFLISGAILNCTRGEHAAGPATVASNAAEKVYVAPGKHDEFYAFLSGGFSGQLAVYGLPSGRLLKVLPVFSVDPQSGYGYSEETKPMLETSHGFVPWDDLHHVEMSLAKGVPDGRWVFVNSNNTPRIARIDLTTFETAEIIEIPNSGGNHGSPFSTENSEYLLASTRFGVPIPQKDVPISSYKKNFRASVTFVSVNPKSGELLPAFQILTPAIDYDLGHCGKGPSKDWCFFTSYNSEQAHTLLEVNASKNDKDLLGAFNWKRAEECVAQGKAKAMPANYNHNIYDDKSMSTKSTRLTSIKTIEPQDCPGLLYYIPVPKSPHGVDIDPSGQFIATGGKLAAQITVYGFDKIIKAIEEKKFETAYEGISVLDYGAVVAGVVEKPCLGPLHTEFDGKGFAYTSCFITSEVVKWKLGEWNVVDRIPTYYSLGHIMIPGGDTAKPWGKYLLAMNKITKDRYLPTGPDLAQASQLIDISGNKMELLLDFPTIGEPHYAQGLLASTIQKDMKKIYKLDENTHPFVTKTEKDSKVERKGNEVHVKMTMIRSHPSPDNIEGIKVGDTVYFHVTNIEQDWDIAHGFAIFGSENTEVLLLPGQTRTLIWKPKSAGIYPFYCTDFCSALHQEMQGYLRVSAAGSDVPISYSTGLEEKAVVPAKSEEASAPVVKGTSMGIGPITTAVKIDNKINEKMAASGKALFESKCVACHKVETRYIGPALQGVTDRRRPEWIMNMILNPDQMILKDETAKALLKEYVAPMANQSLKPDEARLILEYFRKNDSKK
jgi:nitrous-oxide reductase